MNNRATLKSLYSEIRTVLFKMIPEKWDSVYLYASVIDSAKNQNSGEMFFYFYPKSLIRKNPINVYEVPSKFNIDENSYMILATKLYDLIKMLRRECFELEGKAWSNITISIENVEFLAEYNYDDLNNSLYTNENRRIIWQYKYLDYPIEKMNKEEKEVLTRYLKEEEMGEHKIETYSETFYQEHIHNSIQYNSEIEQPKIGRAEANNSVEQPKRGTIKEDDEEPKVRNQLLKF